MKKLIVKTWIIDKAEVTSRRYQCYVNREWVDDEYTKVTVIEELGETEKAIQVRIATGAIVGSAKGWKLWIPKSQIKAA